MRTPHPILALALLLTACSTTPDPALEFYRITQRAGDNRQLCDTVSSLRKHAEVDEIVGKIHFTHNGIEHTVSGWSDDHYAPMDGGSFWLELDSLGEIYGRSTTWPGFMVVHTNNDSLNTLIALALGAAYRPSPFGIDRLEPSIPTIETLQFIAVEEEDTLAP